MNTDSTGAQRSKYTIGQGPTAQTLDVSWLMTGPNAKGFATSKLAKGGTAVYLIECWEHAPDHPTVTVTRYTRADLKLAAARVREIRTYITDTKVLAAG